MSDNWHVGDLAVCIDTRPHPETPVMELVRGRIYRVIFVGLGSRPHPILGGDGGRLGLAGVKPDNRRFFAARRFRKIDAADEQFTARIRACKPINSPVSA